VFKNNKVDIRLRALKFNLDQLNSAYDETTRDSVTDAGLEYGVEYPYNDDTFDMLDKPDKLRKSREDVIFFTILNFTQVFYSVKEYLKKEYPLKKSEIENFFSSRHLNLKARKEISNDLKHNPSADLKYQSGQIGKEETKREGTTVTTTVNYRRTWFYYGIDSVDYCNNLYSDLIDFLTKEFRNVK